MMMSRRAETADIWQRVYRRRWPNPLLRLGSGAALAAILLCGSAVHADVAPPPATNCPLGSVGSSGHGGAYCSPQKCVDDSTCTGGLKCRAYALCLAEETYQTKGGTYTRSVAKGACYNGETCVDGSTCSQGSYCMSATANTAVETSPGGTDSGCSCSQTPARQRLFLLLLGIVGIVALGSLRWGRQRKRSG